MRVTYPTKGKGEEKKEVVVGCGGEDCSMKKK